MRLSLLKKKDFRIFIIGKFISVIGSNLQQFALSLYVYAKTGSATIFAAMLSISILPRLILSPFAGVFGDWFDRKKMIVRLDVLNGILLSVFALIFLLNGGLSIAIIFVLVVMLEITEIFYGAASSAIVPSIVSKEELPQAISLTSLILSLAQLVAPILGAALYGFLGLFIILVVNGLSFLLTGILEIFMFVPATHKKPEKISTKMFYEDFKEGLTVIKENKFIRTMIFIAIVVNFVFAPIFSVGLLVLIVDHLKASEFQYGLFQSVIMFAMILGPIISANLLKKKKITNVCLTSLFTLTLVLIFIAILFNVYIFSMFESLQTPYIVLLVLGLLLGINISIINVSIGTLFSQTVPLHLMGRVSTTMNLLVTVAIPVGQILFGLMFDYLPAFYTIIIGGLIVLITLLIFKNTLLGSIKTENPVIHKGELSYEN